MINENEIELINGFQLQSLAESLLEKDNHCFKDQTMNSLEIESSTLWNTASISFKNVTSEELKPTLLRVMLFASLLLGIHDFQKKRIPRVWKLYLKLCAFAIDEKEMAVAKKTYNLAEVCLNRFNAGSSLECRHLVVETYMAGTSLALKTGDIGTARLHDSKLTMRKDFESGAIDTKCLLGHCRVLFNSSLELFDRGDLIDSSIFVERAFQYLELIDKDNLARRAIEESVLSLLTRNCIESQNYDKARNFIEYFQQSFPLNSEPFVLALKLMTVMKAEDEEKEQTLLKMIVTIPISKNFEVMNSAILEQATTDVAGAMRCLDYLIFNKLEDHELLERAFTTRVWMSIAKNSVATIDDVSAFFNSIEKLFAKPLSKKISNALVTLLWNHSSSLKKQQNFEEAVKWLELCLHRLVKNEISEKGKIQRNILRCYVSLGQFDKVSALFHLIDEETQNNPLTQFYLFKSCLMKKDQEGCFRSIDKIKLSTDKNRVNVLGVCTVQSSEMDLQEVSIYSMGGIMNILIQGIAEHKIAEVMSVTDDLLIVSALRSVIKLLLNEHENRKDGDAKESLSHLMKLFQHSAEFASALALEKKTPFENVEQEWFASHAYNLGLSSLNDQEYGTARSLSNVSLTFIDLYKHGSDEKAQELKVWHARSVLMYLYSTLQLASSDESSGSKELYCKDICAKNRRWIDDIAKILADIDINDPTAALWRTFEYQGLALNFEAELILEDFISAKAILAESKTLPVEYSTEFDKTVANTIIRRSLDPLVKSSLLILIFDNHIGELNTVNSKIITKWSRHILTNLMVNDDANWDRITKEMQIRLNLTHASDPFPVEEIQWLCTTAWNRGVTQAVTKGPSEAERWCRYSIDLSQYISSDAESHYKKLYDDMLNELKSC